MRWEIKLYSGCPFSMRSPIKRAMTQCRSHMRGVSNRHDAKHPRSRLKTVSRSIIGMTRVFATLIDRHPHPASDHVIRPRTIHNVGML
ncbi:hypothetical protein ACLOJK_020338 [Asimina triloba]